MMLASIGGKPLTDPAVAQESGRRSTTRSCRNSERIFGLR